MGWLDNLDIRKVGYSGNAEVSPVAFKGSPAVSGDGFSERHGNGKAAGIESNGIIGSVTGTGENGQFKLKNLYA